VREPKFISLGEAIQIHNHHIQKQIEDGEGGSQEIADLGLLKSAIAQPQIGSKEGFLYKNLFEMAATYAFHIIKNHPFVDANKRTGMTCAIAFLEENGYQMTANSDQLYETATGIANNLIRKEEVVRFFQEHSRPSQSQPTDNENQSSAPS